MNGGYLVAFLFGLAVGLIGGWLVYRNNKKKIDQRIFDLNEYIQALKAKAKG